MKENLIEQLKNYEDKWVALLEPEKKVVASGDDASEAKREAEKRGHKKFILLKVFPFRAGYVPFL
jgi:hypothetical protein